MNTSPSLTESRSGIPRTSESRTSRQTLARFATAAASTTTVLAALLIGGSGAALAAGAHFVPEDTDARWNGSVATVTFREVDVTLEAAATTISVKVTADVDALCTRGESKLDIHRSATALATKDHPITADGTVPGTARIPLRVPGLQVSGWTCTIKQVAVTATLEDFWTGATLTHRTGPVTPA